MKKLLLLIIIFSIIAGCGSKNEKNKIVETIAAPVNEAQKIQFPSIDSLPITANLYDHGSESPVIVLCHQAGFNKIEYTEIAKTLLDKGFNCLAIDQRSGGHIIESFNETLLAANEKKVPVEFLDAEQDIVAAINYASKKYGKKVILWGSSYSSTLSLHIACENKNVEAVVAFSPGNYFDEQKGKLKDKLSNLDIPMFVTSSKLEANDLSAILDSVSLEKNQIQFIPKSDGNHGSRALWKTDKDHEEYWEAILEFLDKLNRSI